MSTQFLQIGDAFTSTNDKNCRHLLTCIGLFMFWLSSNNRRRKMGGIESSAAQFNFFFSILYFFYLIRRSFIVKLVPMKYCYKSWLSIAHLKRNEKNLIIIRNLKLGSFYFSLVKFWVFDFDKKKQVSFQNYIWILFTQTFKFITK